MILRTLMLFALALCITPMATSCGPKSLAALNAAFDCTTQARADLVTSLEPTVTSGMQVIKDAAGKISTLGLEGFFGKPNLETEGGVILACAEQKVAALLAGLLPKATAVSALSTRTSGVPIDAASLQAALDQQHPGVKFKVAP